MTRNPSLLEVQSICELSEPSSLSEAVPRNVTELPSVNSELEEGDSIDTVGVVFVVDSVIVTVMESVFERLPESVAVAVMV